jgi:pyruvate dehydrogenase E2 component (dihydrolipoamide acetyltransferase)
VAPALADAAQRPIAQLMAELSGLVRRARAGVLRSADLAEPSLTITQLGDQGAEAVLGVIRPPQVALVGFGRIAERAWAQDGWLRPMPVVVASLAADHRVSDGHRGAVFLATLRECLQQPAALDAPSTSATPNASSDLSPPAP